MKMYSFLYVYTSNDMALEFEVVSI